MKKVRGERLTIKILSWIIFSFWMLFVLIFVTSGMFRSVFYPIKYKDLVCENADYYGLDRTMVFSVIYIESKFDKDAKSSKGAVGLMQITPKTGEFIASMQGIENYSLDDIKTNVSFGCYYLKYLLLKYDNTDTAIIAYNAGEGNVSLWLTLSEYSNDGVTLYNIPFGETREYLDKYKKTFIKYKKIYGNILDKKD